MIYLIGTPTEWTGRYTRGDWNVFYDWLVSQSEVEFDIETTVSDWWCDKKLITVQFGNGLTQWVLQWSALTDKQKLFIKQALEAPSLCKLIHNALFECTVMLFHEIRLINVYDTMLAEMVLQGGEHNIGYSLADLCFKRLDIELDKSQQLLFGDNILTPEKVVYAAQDVRYLSPLRKHISDNAIELGYDTFSKVVDLENSIVPAFAEMVYHGMEVDQKWWLDLVRNAEPLVAAAQVKLNHWLTQEPFASVALALGYVAPNDRVLLNWNSPKQKALLFQELYPNLPGTTKAILSKWQSTQLKNQQFVPSWLPFYLDGDFSEVTKEVALNHRDWLITKELLIPAGTPTINWNSIAQALPIIQTVEKVKDLSAESLGRTSHEIVKDYEEYKDTSKLLSAFGEEWLKKYVEPDGKVRTSFRQVLTTGRISSSAPNMQQIPAKESVGTKYRNAFIPPANWKFVSSDYISQELINIAYLSKDPVWMEALSKGQDLHSIAAEMVFGRKWKDAAEKDCAFYVTSEQGEPARQKCSCKRHKHMRNGVKTINFGLAYGMSEFKLSSTLRIPVPEAKQLIVDYFKAFPGIGKLLDFLGKFGVQKGYIQTIYPLYRRRWFPNWKFYTRFVDAHLMEAQYHSGLGEIERASKNQPIQGTGADTMKMAIRLVYEYIHKHQLSDKVHMIMQVHDQLDCVVTEEYAEQWSQLQTKLLEEAALTFIPTGILKADTTITSRWSK